MTLQLKKATKEKCKLRLIIMGLPGSGKTYSALEIAKHLAPKGKILLLDSEFGSASKYADKFDFYTEEVKDCDPRNYIKLIKEADALGIDVLILDSLSHAWHALLEIVEKSGGTNKSPYGGWNKGTPIQNDFVETILASKCHIIATARQKSDWVLETKADGKAQPKKVGLKVDQRQEIDYEFDVVGVLENDHTMTITKSRCPEVDQKTFYLPGEEFAKALKEWLDGGVEPTKEDSPKSVPTADINGQTAPAQGDAHVADEKPGAAQFKQLLRVAQENGWERKQVADFLCLRYDITKDNSHEMTWEQWKNAVDILTNPKNANGKAIVDAGGQPIEV